MKRYLVINESSIIHSAEDLEEVKNAVIQCSLASVHDRANTTERPCQYLVVKVIGTTKYITPPVTVELEMSDE